MTDPESLSLRTESSLAPESQNTGETTQTFSDVSGTNVPLSVVALNQQACFFRAQQRRLPELPSHCFEHSVWHDLRENTLKGDELKAPRIRKAPEEKEKKFHKVLDDEENLIHHSHQGKEWNQYRNTTENWENAKVVHLTYQELQDKYQSGNLKRILARLGQVVDLTLMHNGIYTLKSMKFPQCEYLNLNNNYIPSFKDLPSIPRIKCLLLEDNDIADLTGLQRLKSTNIEELYLKGNPVTFSLGYRQKVFSLLPALRVLDGIPRLPADDEVPEEVQVDASRCVIS